MGYNDLQIQMVNSVSEAPDYKESSEPWISVTLDKAVIVRGGTVTGKNTVDLQFSDDKGNKYVALITGNLLKSVTNIINKDQQHIRFLCSKNAPRRKNRK